MNDSTRGFRLHGPRRHQRGPNPTLPLSLTFVLVCIVLVVVLTRQSDPPPSLEAAPLPTATTVVPAPQTPTATPSPASSPTRVESEWVTIEAPSSPTVSITRQQVSPVPTRAARPTPGISQCTRFRWSTMQVFSPSAQVKVDIRVDNRCPYDLGPDNLLIEITGWRQGDRVQRVRGVPFEVIRRGRSGEVSIGLPGSADWYDEITVVVLD